MAGPVANSSPLGKPTRLSSQVLLADRREVEIEHAGQIYRLRLTSLGKLILTK
ncbi:hemin uptake protein HemP [Paucibacter sp. DJ1R-11]|nr:hemin uptake protein HemP [Paucibacter sp. DJ1R-11]MCV2363242.1 hemin uptake protein HemP [Paucibacter sp. DJ1R-11]